MNQPGHDSFENAADLARREMLKLTPGQRIVRALELAELGRRLQQATRAAQKRTTDACSVSEPPGATYKAK